MFDWKEVYPEYVSPSGRPKRNLTAEQKNEVWVYRASQAHGNKYKYLNTYTGVKCSMQILCPEHGVFSQGASNHMSAGQGCPRCGDQRVSKALSSTQESMINRFVAAHGDRYDYSKVVYEGANSRVLIVCAEHGEFRQRCADHALGSNCPKCSKSPSSEVYLMSVGTSGVYKIGITNDVARRRRENALDSSEEVTIVASASVPNPSEVEKSLLSKYTINPYEGRKAATSAFTEYRTLNLEEVAGITELLSSL